MKNHEIKQDYDKYALYDKRKDLNDDILFKIKMFSHIVKIII